MTTVDKFTEVLGIERIISYGFLRFIAEAGLVKTSKLKKAKGGRGKPSTIYHLDATLGPKLVAYLEKHLGELMNGAEIQLPPEAIITSVAKDFEQENTSATEPCQECEDVPPEDGGCKSCKKDECCCKCVGGYQF